LGGANKKGSTLKVKLNEIRLDLWFRFRPNLCLALT
jgi:hypothetical protein